MNLSELSLLLKEGEGLTVEFKESYSSKITHDIVAFSNSKGGRLFIGVDDYGNIKGESYDNSRRAEIVDLARNCDPSIEIETEYINSMIVVHVQEGNTKPYSCSDGYFKRIGAVTQKLKQDEIRKMFQESAGLSYEELPCRNFKTDNISLSKLNDFLSEAEIELKAEENNIRDLLNSLNLISDRKIFNAGALLFADQIEKFIIHAQMSLICFKGENKVEIFNRRDIRDDLLTQFNEAVFFLEKHLSKGSKIEGVNRKEEYEIPLEVLREAVANAIVHRDYSITGTSITVEIYSDRVEITNPGGLPPGLDRKNFGKISVRRNERIADLFYRMKKVEKIGSGIQRIRSIMKQMELEPPEFEINSSFQVTFYRPVYKIRLNHTERKIIRLMKENNSISKKELAESLDISITAIDKNIAKLKKKKVLTREGPAKGGYWRVLV